MIQIFVAVNTHTAVHHHLSQLFWECDSLGFLQTPPQKTSEMDWKIFLSSLKDLWTAISLEEKQSLPQTGNSSLTGMRAEHEQKVDLKLWIRAKNSHNSFTGKHKAQREGGGLWVLAISFAVRNCQAWRQLHSCFYGDLDFESIKHARLFSFNKTARKLATNKKQEKPRVKQLRIPVWLEYQLTFRNLNSSIIPLNYSNLCPSPCLSPSPPSEAGTMAPCALPVLTGRELLFTAGQDTQLSGRQDPFLSSSLPDTLPPPLSPSLSGSQFYFHFPALVCLDHPHNCLPPSSSPSVSSPSLVIWVRWVSSNGSCSVRFRLLCPVWTSHFFLSFLNHTHGTFSQILLLCLYFREILPLKFPATLMWTIIIISPCSHVWNNWKGLLSVTLETAWPFP